MRVERGFDFDDVPGVEAASADAIWEDEWRAYHVARAMKTSISAGVMTSGGEMHLALAFNPSHLEIVGPVVEGSVRARQDRRGDEDREQVVPVVVHGDAAFAGQGVVMETLQMSQSRGYLTHGTVHIIINNQIGFTTSAQNDARSTYYSTDIAKMVGAPIFHVNADDPEAVIMVTRIALEYRNIFKKDVVIDMMCYRRHGHNEADEPSATQPMMYKKIRALESTREIYAKKIVRDKVEAGEIDENDYKTIQTEISNQKKLIKDRESFT